MIKTNDLNMRGIALILAMLLTYLSSYYWRVQIIVFAILASLTAFIVFKYGPKFMIFLPNSIVIEKIAFLIEQGKLEELK